MTGTPQAEPAVRPSPLDRYDSAGAGGLGGGLGGGGGAAGIGASLAALTRALEDAASKIGQAGNKAGGGSGVGILAPKGGRVQEQPYFAGQAAGETGIQTIGRGAGIGLGAAYAIGHVANTMTRPSSYGEQQAGFGGLDKLNQSYNPLYGAIVGNSAGGRITDAAGATNAAHNQYVVNSAGSDPNDWRGRIQAQRAAATSAKQDELRGQGFSPLTQQEGRALAAGGPAAASFMSERIAKAEHYQQEMSQFEAMQNRTTGFAERQEGFRVQNSVDTARLGQTSSVANYQSEQIRLQSAFNRKQIANDPNLTDEQRSERTKENDLGEAMGIAKLGRGVGVMTSGEAAAGPAGMSNQDLRSMADNLSRLVEIANRKSGGSGQVF